ncbi:hypothetical protein KUTeg_007728 [Tegillarca granosa]|uniref:PAS domain-containing protein n=1 Tax=Tegillarca granosa TaxID=220873 RepID=A0ABQ9FE23_TEGGR|nr:hypothetical protein KUTeg_007728 [Tegillarca granosa]
MVGSEYYMVRMFDQRSHNSACLPHAVHSVHFHCLIYQSRELTFKSKHKMDFSPMSMDSRGKMMFGFSDRELATKSGYDLIHPDDLSYFSAAHQELIKTGSSGLIAYRWSTKDFRWLWLQSSCKVIYKNSKPDFVICTHRQLTDDEGQDLFHKRGNEFKLPYPLLDLDICSGFDFPNDDLITKMKNGKNKKQKNQVREFIQSPVRKRKGACRENVNGLNGYNGYPQYNGYDAGEFKPPDIIYPYPANNIIEPDIYRSHGYAGFPGSVYPPPEPYRLDTEKHGYTNGYYLDPHRQYQHTLSYHGNGYPDFINPATKYSYDVSKYGLDGYSLDLAKKVHYGDELTRYDNDFRKYAYDYGNDRLPTRLNGALEPVDLRSSSMYTGGALVNGVDSMVGHPSCLSSSTLFKSDSIQGQNLLSKETKVIRSPSDVIQNQGITTSMPLQHSSVIKNTASPRTSQHNSQSSNSDQMGSPPLNNYSSVGRVNVINNGATWNQCSKSGQSLHPSPNSTPRSENAGSPKHNGLLMKSDNGMHTSSPVNGATPASVIHTPVTNRSPPNRSCDKQPLVGGIPVPVVKSPWIHGYPSHNSYGDPKDWAAVPSSDMYSCHQKPRGIITEAISHKVTLP